MDATEAIWIFVITLTLVAGLVDFRTRKIPNIITIPGMVAGITLRTAMSGWAGTKVAVEGVLLALVLLLPLVLARALGAGDWKLMGAVGAFVGPIIFLFVLFGSIVVSGLMALVEMVRTKRVRETLENMLVLLRGFISFGLRRNSEISLDNPKLLKVPFGVAVAVSTVACFWAARLSK
jgi:prepilin peptidase CpaA